MVSVEQVVRGVLEGQEDPGAVARPTSDLWQLSFSPTSTPKEAQGCKEATSPRHALSGSSSTPAAAVPKAVVMTGGSTELPARLVTLQLVLVTELGL